MTNASGVETKWWKKSVFSYLTWWKIEPAEMERQITQYNKLKVWQSARGKSSLFCVFFIVVVWLTKDVAHRSTGDIVPEGIAWLSIAIFMFRGHRWAFILGMALWTIEKGMGFFYAWFPNNGLYPLPIIWWVIYMHAFFLAYKVESVRRLPIVEVKTV
jgi:hypothetical protein